MLVEDTTAFIEHIEVRQEGKRAAKGRRRLAQAGVEVMRLQLEVRLLDQALRGVAHELVASRERPASEPGRRLVRDRRERTLERELAGLRGRLADTRSQLQAKREHLKRLEDEAQRLEESSGCVRVIRLHSARHHLEYSEQRFARLARSQFVLPVLVAKREGRRWWWYSDRFWWDDVGLSAREVEALVLRSDFSHQRRAEELANARASLLGEERESLPERSLPPVVRFAVRCRDRGRCVDCGSSRDVGYDQIVPYSRGGWRWIANVELRCEPCRERRQHNEVRTRVDRARVEAASAVH
jgi:5-methylcytosine-specific restriction endonuclease McrA